MTTLFPDKVFAVNKPAQLRQGDWLSDVDFLQQLETSWRSQYADYIGEQQAKEHIELLRRQGTLYDHHVPSTIHAWVDDQIVGVTSLRPLKGIDLITMLEVRQPFRGLGIGSQLLEALCGASDCLMAHVSVHQPRVIDFYVRSGFKTLQRAYVRHGSHELEFEVVARKCGKKR